MWRGLALLGIVATTTLTAQAQTCAPYDPSEAAAQCRYETREYTTNWCPGAVRVEYTESGQTVVTWRCPHRS